MPQGKDVIEIRWTVKPLSLSQAKATLNERISLQYITIDNLST